MGCVVVGGDHAYFVIGGLAAMKMEAIQGSWNTCWSLKYRELSDENKQER